MIPGRGNLNYLMKWNNGRRRGEGEKRRREEGEKGRRGEGKKGRREEGEILRLSD
jgi:hypothetical protein